MYYTAALLHCVDLACGILYPFTCSFGFRFPFSSLQLFKYTTWFGPTDDLQVCNLVYRSFEVTGTDAGSFLGWHCAAIHVFHSFLLEFLHIQIVLMANFYDVKIY
jgi:hypothetical protein